MNVTSNTPSLTNSLGLLGDDTFPSSSLVTLCCSALNGALNIKSGDLVLISGLITSFVDGKVKIDDGTGVFVANVKEQLMKSVAVGNFVDAFLRCCAKRSDIPLNGANQSTGPMDKPFVAFTSLEIVGLFVLSDPNAESLRILEMVARCRCVARTASAPKLQDLAHVGFKDVLISKSANLHIPQSGHSSGMSGVVQGQMSNTTSLPHQPIHPPSAAIHSAITSSDVLQAVRAAQTKPGHGNLASLAAALGAPPIVVSDILEDLQMNALIYTSGDQYFTL